MLTNMTLMIVALLWSGMILGISFLESWVKFRAPRLNKIVGLDVGRTVFGIFHKVQMGILLIMIVLSIFTVLSWYEWLTLCFLIVILLSQTFLLMPRLNQRVTLITAGVQPPKSFIHTLYGLLELGKLLFLLELAINIAKNL